MTREYIFAIVLFPMLFVFEEWLRRKNVRFCKIMNIVWLVVLIAVSVMVVAGVLIRVLRD